MEPFNLSRAEIAERSDSLYAKLRPLVETEENIGKIVSLDITSGDYEVDADLLKAGRRLQERHPDALIVSKRIGYNAVYAIGGTLTRTKPA